jgi:hypothetical protein
VCVHCGGPVQASRDAAPAFDPRAILEGRMRLPAPGGEAPEPAEEAEAAEARAPRGARLGMTVVWIALAVLASVLRMCQERGG